MSASPDSSSVALKGFNQVRGEFAHKSDRVGGQRVTGFGQIHFARGGIKGRKNLVAHFNV